MIVDAEGSIVGRLASYVAKNALNGETVIVVNADKAIISGKQEMVLSEEQDKLDIRNLGNPRNGPFHQRRPDRYLRKSIRGMLPYKKPNGKAALDRVKVFLSVPEGYESDRLHRVEQAQNKLTGKFITLGSISKKLGARSHE